MASSLLDDFICSDLPVMFDCVVVSMESTEFCLFFLSVAMWGSADAIWQTQVHGKKKI